MEPAPLFGVEPAIKYGQIMLWPNFCPNLCKILWNVMIPDCTALQGNVLIYIIKKPSLRRLVTGKWPALQDSNLRPTA